MDREYFVYLSENSRTRVRRYFDVSVMVENTVGVYEGVLSGDNYGRKIGRAADGRGTPP